MFQIQGLSKIYPQRHGPVAALRDISLRIARGSFVTITGESGSGKTTLLLTLGGLIRPTSGNVIVGGADLYTMPDLALSAYRNKSIGFVLQTFNLVPYLTAIENVMVPMVFANGDGKTSRPRADALLEHMGLSDRAEHLPRELSVGQQQRVAIARALANDPQVILADEPTGNLDPRLSTEVLDVLRALNERDGRTVVMVTHRPDGDTLGTHHIRLIAGCVSNAMTTPSSCGDGN
jgi:putative ABC transport system ATP-binding protein